MKLLTLLLVLLVPTASGVPHLVRSAGVVLSGRDETLRGTSDDEALRGVGQHMQAGIDPAGLSAGVPLQGWATYFDAKSGTAAAGPLLRSGDWRGRVVTVCAGECVVVRLTGWCACGSRHGKPTLLDLAKSDFARLAPPSQGIVWVTVGRATLPATDMETMP
jgi:hypothetical protein